MRGQFNPAHLNRIVSARAQSLIGATISLTGSHSYMGLSDMFRCSYEVLFSHWRSWDIVSEIRIIAEYLDGKIVSVQFLKQQDS